MQTEIFKFLVPGRNLVRKKKHARLSQKDAEEKKREDEATGLTYSSNDPRSKVKCIRADGVRQALHKMPLATGAWTDTYMNYLQTHHAGESAWVEYRTLLQRYLGFARLTRGMSTEIENDEELDSEEGGLLDRGVCSLFSLSLSHPPPPTLTPSLTGDRGVPKVPGEWSESCSRLQLHRQAPRRHYSSGRMEGFCEKNHLRVQGGRTALRHPGEDCARYLSRGGQGNTQGSS